MPIYDYECENCGKTYEIDQTMTENYENPPEFCPNCDPECEGDPTLFKLFSKIKPSFNLKGDGYYKGGWN
jgi:putative FmdB family regulatory protein